VVPRLSRADSDKSIRASDLPIPNQSLTIPQPSSWRHSWDLGLRKSPQIHNNSPPVKIDWVGNAVVGAMQLLVFGMPKRHSNLGPFGEQPAQSFHQKLPELSSTEGS
jgi:hypothetical protein